MENKTDREGILAEHGLSIYIEAQGKKILFDAGASNLFASNAAKLKVDLGAVDFAVVSHGHYDHTGGFPIFHQINPKAPIYIHRNALRVSYGTEGGALGEGGVLDKEPCSIRWTDKELKDLADQLMFTDGPVEITEDIKITGTVPYAEGFKPTDYFYCYDGDPLHIFRMQPQRRYKRSERGKEHVPGREGRGSYRRNASLRGQEA